MGGFLSALGIGGAGSAASTGLAGAVPTAVSSAEAAGVASTAGGAGAALLGPGQTIGGLGSPGLAQGLEMMKGPPSIGTGGLQGALKEAGLATAQNSPIRHGIANAVTTVGRLGGRLMNQESGGLLGAGLGAAAGNSAERRGQQSADNFLNMFEESVARARRRKQGTLR